MVWDKWDKKILLINDIDVIRDLSMRDISIILEHKSFYKQIIRLSLIELKKIYQGTIFGVFWIVIKPIVTLSIFWFIFEFGIRNSVPIAGIDRFSFMAVGFIAWFYMQESILSGIHCLRKNKVFVTKIQFPVSTIMTIHNLSRIYVHIFLLCLLYLYIYFNVGISIYNLQILFYLPIMFIFFLSLSWSTSMYSAYSKDFANTVQTAIQGIFWISGIVWDTYSIHNETIKFIMMFNPINYFANGYRKTFLYKEWFWNYPLENAIFFLELFLVFIMGIYSYKKLRKTISDVI